VSKAVLAAGARVFSQVSSAIAVCRNNVAPDATEVAWPEWLMCLVRQAGRRLRGAGCLARRRRCSRRARGLEASAADPVPQWRGPGGRRV